jgi:hypothetical protein
MALGLLLLCLLAKAATLAAHQQCPSGNKYAREVLQKASSAAILDAQAFKMADQPGGRGFDAGKESDGGEKTRLSDIYDCIENFPSLIARRSIQPSPLRQIPPENCRFLVANVAVVWLSMVHPKRCSTPVHHYKPFH